MNVTFETGTWLLFISLFHVPKTTFLWSLLNLDFILWNHMATPKRIEIYDSEKTQHDVPSNGILQGPKLKQIQKSIC